MPAHWSPANADLPTSGVTAGTYGDATDVGQFTVNAAGIITAASAVPISGGGGGGGIVQASKVALTSGDLTTSSTSFVNATGLTTTITTGAHRCLILFSGAGHNDTTGDNIAVDVAIDTARQGQTYGLTLGQSTGSQSINQNLSFVYLTAALTAASHTFQIMFRVDGTSTGTLFASAGVSPAIITVIELGI